MHYYQFNIGDYASHTRGLSLYEDLAYRRMMDEYYLSEQALNGCSADVARCIGMREQQQEVDYVLNRFFEHEDGKWTHKRIDKEINEFHSGKESKSKAGKASAEARRIKALEQTLEQNSTGVEQALNSVELTKNQEPITNNHSNSKAEDAPQPPRKQSAERFVKPTIENLIAEFIGRVHDPNLQAQKFHAHYESNGWKVGKNPMRSWKAAVTTWVTRSNENANNHSKNPQHGLQHTGVAAKLSTVGRNSLKARNFLAGLEAEDSGPPGDHGSVVATVG